MAKRMREYTDLLLERLVRNAVPEREGGLPWVLPVVAYNGSERWTAPGEVSELASLPSARAERDLALLQPQRYRRLDAGARSPDDWPAENRVAATVRLQRSGSSRDLLARLREETERFPGAENEAFRRALYAWAKALAADRTDDGLELPSFGEMERAEGVEMTTLLEANLNRWDAKVRAEYVAEGVERGRAEGIARGRAEEGKRLLGRLATAKFDTFTAKRLSGLLEGLTAREDLDRVSDWIIECPTGEEFLSRVSALRVPARTGPGDARCGQPGREYPGARAHGAGRRRRELRDSSFGVHDALNQAMDSRFRGNDVIRARYVTLATTVIPAIAVIPAEAGIHYGQRIPKLE